MVNEPRHDLRIGFTRDERSRQEFVAALRGHVLDRMSARMRRRYRDRIAPAAERAGHQPHDGAEVHRLMRDDTYFRFYSSVRFNAQEMVFGSVISGVERQLDAVNERASGLRQRPDAAELELDPDFEVPRSVSAIDVHLAPGGYHTEYAPDDCAAGAIYDHSLGVFGYGQMGPDHDDIGWTMSKWLSTRHPEFRPGRILDCGCTVGHNTVPWALNYPDAEVHGIDVSAPLLRYAAARATSLGAPVRFAQMNATSLSYPDESFDVVFSSMFLHELPLKDIRAYMREAFRVLRPGGLLLNMELPPNNRMPAYEQFYLDWDSYYNNEPFYKPFRDQDYRKLCTAAGFAPDGFIEFTAPRYTYTDEKAFQQAVAADPHFDHRTGRFSAEIRWYAFGSWKQAGG